MINELNLAFEHAPASEQQFMAVRRYIPERPAGYMSHPVFKGADVSIAIASTAMQIDTEVLSEQQRRHVADIRGNARDRLQDFYNLVHRAIECGQIWVDCRFVHELRDPLSILDGFRIREFRDGELLRQYPYQQRIFPDDGRQPPRFLTFLSVESFYNISQLMREATDYLLQDGLDEDESLFESLIWMPLRETASLPSLTTRPNPSAPMDADLPNFPARIRRDVEPRTVRLSGLVIEELKA